MKSEFDFIKGLREKANGETTRKSVVQVGIGDDAAVIRTQNSQDTVITTDLLIEDVDFRRTWCDAKSLGHKALAVSLSDIAAMGAKPSWALVSIAVPEEIWESDFVKQFYEGWFELADKFNVKLAGGDVSKSEKITIDSIAAGEIRRNNALLRSGAKVGDLIFVTGTLGGAAAGLRLLENGERPDIINTENTENVESSQSPNHNLMTRQLKPNPQTVVGKLLPREGLATSAIDLSDGLSSDLRHVCEASGVGAKIYLDKLPFDVNLLGYSEAEKLDFALNGGEDYELLFTVRPRMARNRSKLLAKFPSTCIGEITGDAGKIELVSENEVVTLENRGFRHF